MIIKWRIPKKGNQHSNFHQKFTLKFGVVFLFCFVLVMLHILSDLVPQTGIKRVLLAVGAQSPGNHWAAGAFPDVVLRVCICSVAQSCLIL